ncbi:MAG: hypothetical protein WCO40_06730 [Thermoleophilia bacterium]
MSLQSDSPLAPYIDLEQYPIHDLDSPAGRALLERCQTDLRAQGACQLDGFLSAEGIALLADEAASLSDQTFRNEVEHNAYFEDIEPGTPEDDPRRMMERASQATVAYDLIPENAGIRGIYDSDDFLRFVGESLEKDPFYRNADPLGAVNLVYYEEGDELGWHFDRAEFVVTMMIQPAKTGGDFEYVPYLRSETEENYPRVKSLLEGDLTEAIHLPSKAGTLAFFRGRHSIHRVTPIEGDVLRVNAVLSFADKPGHKLNALTQEMFYGRTA